LSPFHSTGVPEKLEGVPATPVRHDEQTYASAEECLQGIRDRVGWGWEISELRPLDSGYRVVFRLHVPETEQRRQTVAAEFGGVS